MKLQKIIQGVEVLEQSGDASIEVSDIQQDSRKVSKGSMFVAVKGTRVDGHKFIEKAIANGATAIVSEYLDDALAASISWIKVGDSAKALGQLAANFYGRPSDFMKVVAVTGTNGKTSVVTLLHELFSSLGFTCGLLSTIENKIGQEVFEATHTTPDAIMLQQSLAKMKDSGCTHVFMEASSHAIDQRRIEGLDIDTAIFTNISHDHLDYHETFAKYISAKKQLFDGLKKGAFALVNVDDKRGMVMVQNTKATIKTFAVKKPADYKAKVFENSLMGLHLQINRVGFFTRLIGGFNAYNLLAVFGVGDLMQIEKEALYQAVSQLKPARGRFDVVRIAENGPLGIVDYAHTPDALEQVLETIHGVKAKESKVMVVLGCGGDRDKKKRPLMAQIAAQNSDHLILTSDNPRTEDPSSIIRDMEEGVSDVQKRKVLSIEDRSQAIRTAVKLAKSNDVILVAGKGHETYQEINGVRSHFDDKEELTKALNE